MGMKSKYNNEYLDEMSKNPGNWKGPFYFNKRDPRLLVPKLNRSLGWTLNFSKPGAYIAIIVLVAVIVIISRIEK
jgi:uncharacterized membrane protein